MKTIKQKPQIIWATIQIKNGLGRHGDLRIANEIVEVSLYRRILKMSKWKGEKIVRLFTHNYTI